MSYSKLHNHPLAFDEVQQHQIDQTLLRLADNIGAPLVMLADVSGQLILYRGRLSAKQSTGLAALAAGSMAAGVEIGQFLGLRDSFRYQLLEGSLANLYILKLGDDLLLIVAFTQKTTLGMVRVFAQQTHQELLTMIEEAKKRRLESESSGELLNEEFNDALRQQLDELFSEGTELS